MKTALVCFIATVGAALAYDNGPFSRQPLQGWTTWCTDDLCGLWDHCYESEVKSVADYMVSSGMTALGYKDILLDDCWSDDKRDANGNLQPNPNRFPSGMAALADYLHDRNMTLGLYTCSGTYTCKWKRPGSYGHYPEDAATMASWNIDTVKADNCYHPSEPSHQYYGEFSKALNATGHPFWFAMCSWGRDNVWQWGSQIAQSYRVTGDHMPIWSIPFAQAQIQRLLDESGHPLLTTLSAEHALRGPLADKAAEAAFAALIAEQMKGTSQQGYTGDAEGVKALAAVRSLLARASREEEEKEEAVGGVVRPRGQSQGTGQIIELMAGVSNYTVPAGYCDPDFLMTDLWFLTPDKPDSVTEFSLWTLWGGPLMLATDPRNMSSAKAEILTNMDAVAINQDAGGHAAYRVSKDAETGAEVWARLMANGDIAVVLLNSKELGDAAVEVSVTMQALGISSGQASSIKNLWTKGTVGPWSKPLSAALSPRESAMFRVTP